MDFISRFWQSRDDGRREYERLDTVMKVRLVAGDGVVHEVVTRDISLEGFRFVTQSAPPVDQRVTVIFKLGETVQASGVVKWVHSLPDNSAHEGGVAFGWMRQSDRQRWHAFLKHTKDAATAPKAKHRRH